MLGRLLAVAFVCLAFASTGRSQALAPGTSVSVPSINVLNYGAAADAQESGTTLCTVLSGKTTLSCTGGTGAGLFTPADVGKSVQIPTAGNAATSPAPQATAETTITGIVSGTLDPSTLKFKQVTIAAVPNAVSTPVAVTWGTDNTTAFTSAANACPLAANGTGSGSAFTSRGCVLYVPSAGTGDYMFGPVSGNGVVLSSQTSFQVIGMGNSGKYQMTQQAGVRLVTAMPITILTVGQNSLTSNNLGGFQISNISFVDTSMNGSALGGLDMIQVSEAVIAYCDFENFNGQIADAANPGVFPNISAYGMKSDPGTQGAFNNNIVLLHDKGQNDAIWYDSSIPSQDGPIVIGGDVFPITTTNLTSSCYGVVASDTIRLYGTHFDSSTDGNGSGSHVCYGVKMLGSGIVNGKFESDPHNGSAILLQGGFSGQITGVSVNRTTSSYVTATVPMADTFSVGQVVNVASCSGGDTTVMGNFLVTSFTSGSPNNTFTYDQSGTTGLGASTCTVQGVVANAADIEADIANTPTGVLIQQGAFSNKVTVAVGGTGPTPIVTAPVSDSGTSDMVEVLDAQGTGNSTAYNYGAATGAVNMFSLADTTGNTGTGSLLNVATASGSSAIPATITGGPPASSSGAGTNAPTALAVTSANGGATTGTSTTAGNAGPVSITLGAGGSGSGGTNSNGGNGGVLTVNIGAGGMPSGTGSTGKNGEVIFKAPSSPTANLLSLQSSSAADQVYVDSSFGLNAGAGKFDVNSSGQIARYDNLTTTASTGGQGVPVEVNFSSTLGSTASVGPLNLVATTAASTTMYRVSYYLTQASAGTCSVNATVGLTLSWTDPGGAGTAKTLTSAMVSMGSGAIGAGTRTLQAVPLIAQASTSITYSTVFSAGTCSTEPSYSVWLMTEQM